MRTTSAAAAVTPIPLAKSSAVAWRWAALLAFTLPLLFAFITNHVWEDYYITFRASKNLAEGHGLVYQIGERVHSFTSPLGVLLPALFSYLTRSDIAALWCFRVLGCGAVAWAVVMLWQVLETQGASLTARWLVTLVLLSDSKLVDFTINGMETPLMVLFAAALLRLMFLSPTPRPIWFGLVFAGLMWTRPDGFVIALAIIGGALAFTQRSWSKLKDSFEVLTKGALWAIAFYGPWVAWAWWYYGTPIPHTIIAKSGRMPDMGGLAYLFTALVNYLTGKSAMIDLMNPTYLFFGGWPAGIIGLGHALSILAGFLWLVPKLPPVCRMTSLALLLGSYYLQAVPPAPWYFPVWNVLAAVSLGMAAATWLTTNNAGSFSRSVARCTITVVLAIQLSTVGLVAWQARQQQVVIENHGRRVIGEWLAQHGTPTDTVFLEPLGYIGYFSQLHMLDYPGLCAPSVVAAIREVDPTFTGVIRKLQPTWLVLRRGEVLSPDFKQSDILDQYEFARAWDARDNLERISFLPGRGWLEVDAVFLVFHRRTGSAVLVR